MDDLCRGPRVLGYVKVTAVAIVGRYLWMGIDM